jgi:hypothetical protein
MTTGARHRASRWIVAAGAALAVASFAREGRARADGFGYEALLPFGVAGLLGPSEVGVTTSGADPATRRLVLGWSYQFPADDRSRHRVVSSVDLVVHDGAAWRGRLGYRYGRREAFAGGGLGVDGSGLTLSPEIGVKFLHLAQEQSDGLDASLHLLVRADVAPETGRIRAATILLGWNLY